MIIPSSSLSIPDNRHRKSFDPQKIAELADSIERHGLLYPLTVRPDSAQPDQFILIAGERRLRAMKILHKEGIEFYHANEKLSQGQVPVLTMQDIPQEEAYEIELEENILRTDLTWKEHCLAVKQLHEFQVAINPTWTLTDTAEKLSGKRSKNTGNVSYRIALAEELDNPAIAQATNLSQAFSILRKLYEQDFTAAIGAATLVGQASASVLTTQRKVSSEAIDLEKEETPVLEDINHRLLYGDCIKLMQTFEEESFDCILTDPPYGYGAEQFKAQTTLRHTYDDEGGDSWQKLMLDFLWEASRVTKPQAHMYIFCSLEGWNKLRNILKLMGEENEKRYWDIWPRPLIWVKDKGFPAKARYGPEYTYECILYANKGQKEVRVVRRDTLSHPTVKSSKGKIHAAQKPVELYADLLSRSCGIGDSVLDPFVGSGTVFEAAKQLSLIAYGIELDEKMCNIARARLHGKYTELEDEVDEPAAEDLFGDVS